MDGPPSSSAANDLDPASPPSPRASGSAPSPFATEPPVELSPEDIQKELSHIATCVTTAVDELGWLAHQAHVGQFMKTATQLGALPSECADLVDESRARFAIGDQDVVWLGDWDSLKSKGTSADIDLRFYRADDEASGIRTKVTLSHRWHCFGWVHLDAFGEECYETQAACSAARTRHRNATPCSRLLGAAWCVKGKNDCFERPWSCPGTCEKRP